jgi:monofunctional biosynthetic peptidoglycan transglycosylase
MDERKWTFRRIFLRLLLLSLAGFLCLLSYGAIVYYQTQNIKDPRKCFTTSMYKVRLCPGSPDYLFYRDVPDHFYQSLILSEDASFYSHKGFDWFEIKESFRRNISEWRFSRGGSTLTQQLAKNLYLSTEKSLTRKFRELFIAKQIEQRLSKKQILEKYINVVEFGPNIYGLKEAANHYFNKPASSLNVLESIYLVSLLPSPKRLSSSYEKKKLSQDNLWRMNIILKRLYRFKKINDELFVYLQMLLEDSPWPFSEYNNFQYDQRSIEEQMLLEFEETGLEVDDALNKETNESENVNKELETNHQENDTNREQEEETRWKEDDNGE